MNDLKEKRVSVTFALTAVIFVFHILDIFLIKSDRSVLADTVAARVLSIIAVLVVSKMLRFNVRKRCFNGFGFIFELIYGVGFSAASLLVIYAAELVYFKIKGFYREVSVYMLTPDGKEDGLLLPLLIYAVALLINVLFKELYRGFMLSQLGHKFGTVKSNLIQATVCTLMSSLFIVRAFAEGGFDRLGTLDTAITVTVSVVTVFISSLRWGIYYKVNGSIWMAIADHFVNAFVMTCVFFSPDRLPDKWLLIKSLVVQLVTCVIFIPFCYRRERVNDEYVKEMKTRHDVLSAMNEAEPNPTEETASNNYLMMMNETEQEKKFGGIKENEILDFDRKPTEYSKGVLRGYEDKKSSEKSAEREHHSSGSEHRSGSRKHRSRSTENVPESAESISKLVDEYFKKNFDKHTYN